jgi:hypothetical protein
MNVQQIEEEIRSKILQLIIQYETFVSDHERNDWKDYGTNEAEQGGKLSGELAGYIDMLKSISPWELTSQIMSPTGNIYYIWEHEDECGIIMYRITLHYDIPPKGHAGYYDYQAMLIMEGISGIFGLKPGYLRIDVQ